MSKLRERIKEIVVADAVKDIKEDLLDGIVNDVKEKALKEATTYSEEINREKGRIAGNDALLASVAGGAGAITAKVATNAAGNAIGVALPVEAENLLSAAVGLLIVKLVAGIRRRIQNRKKFDK